MKTKKILLILVSILTYNLATAQSSDDILNLLIQKGLLKQNDADSIRADYAIKQQESKEKQKTFGVFSSRNLSIGGYTQLRFQSLQESGKPDGFDIRRARLDIRGNFSPEWEYRLQADFAVATKLVDAYFVYKPFDYFKLTGGQFIIPVSLENTTPDSGLETIDRAQVTGLAGRNKSAIGDQNGRDIGVQVNGSLFKTESNRFLLDYYIAYFNGQGVNIAADKNESKDIATRIVVHPYEFLDFGVSYSNGEDNWTTITKDQKHILLGADLAVTYTNFSLRTEYLQAQEGTYVVNGQTQNLIKNGWYAQVGYFALPKKLQFVAKYDTYDPTKDNPKNDISTFYTFGGNFYPNSFRNSINKDEIVAQLQIKF
jgi:phosphate-selective porin OprO/OprP